ncbi:MAG TPA: type II toxin-antitoxin system VapC family toxin [Hyphomicrobiales bacterium]|nr:type II toxin-antitoxin system VapC family toxin [Hyphomicrobiales bacterium]
MSDLLLDTCALIWLGQGGGELSKEALVAIDAAPIVYVSAISAWELGLLCLKRQIVLPLSVDAWFKAFTTSQDIHVLDVDAAVALAANTLPWHHRDPADRFILASAQLNGLGIVTHDARFENYDIELIG